LKNIIKNQEIEIIVDNRIREYESRNGAITDPCTPIENIIEDCGFKILYDKIEEGSGEKIFGGLDLKSKTIIINEIHIQLFKEKPGLERFTLAHELGHWDVFLNKDSNQNSVSFDFYTDTEGVVFRKSGIGSIAVLTDLWCDDDVYDVFKTHAKKKDHPYVASAVDRYANFLLIPEKFLSDLVLRIDLTDWKALYSLAKTFQVTISALCVRLQRMKLIYIKNKKLYRTKDEAVGQASFGF